MTFLFVLKSVKSHTGTRELTKNKPNKHFLELDI